MRSAGGARWRSGIGAGVALFMVAGGAPEVAGPASQASASATTWYAYAHGEARSPTGCPQTGNATEECTLGEALSKATAGSSVDLASSAQGGVYVGNWTVSTPGTTSSAPLFIRA